MKKLKSIATLCALSYAVFAFIAWDFNPRDWSVWTQAAYVAFTLVLFIAAEAASEDTSNEMP